MAKTATCHPERKHKGNGLCKACYGRSWRAANPGRQWQEKYPEESRRYHAAWYQIHKDEIQARVRDRRETGVYRERDRRIYLQYKYGLTPENYREAEIGQAGRCAICGLVPPDRLVIDHDHKTGRFRGLLCGPCNRAIGHFEDVPRRAAAAARYLERAS